MKNFVMGDVHGCLPAFKAALADIKPGKNRHLYILGDVIDRGDGQWDILDIIMENRGYITLIIGNHEAAFISCEQAAESGDTEAFLFWRSYWKEGGGEDTMVQAFGEWTPERRHRYTDFLRTCPPECMVKENMRWNYLVHSAPADTLIGKINDRELSVYAASSGEDEIFRMKDGLYSVEPGFFTEQEKAAAAASGGTVNPSVWFGHTPVEYIEKGAVYAWHRGRFCGIDCGCAGYSRKGLLCTAELGTDKERYYRTDGTRVLRGNSRGKE